ncbi:MAG: outer membrane protein assembly factor BamD [Deltaproteobacteria bacterium]|nr:outer membrane protein assembly factor BamD [Deltaproteobacteria bacterium]
MKKSLLLTACCLLLTVFTGCASTKDELANGSDPAFLYSEGAALYRDGDYNEAIDRLKKVMEGYPLSPLAVDAELLLADAYYSSNQYSDAASYYANFVSMHPGHPKAAYVLFQKGMSYLREVSTIDRDQTSTQKALLTFSDIISIYPASMYADKAKEMTVFLKRRLADREFYIGNFYFKDKKYKGALVRFAEILKKYPDAGLSDKALYYIGKSYIGLGEKDLAKDTFSTLIANFPDSSFALDAKSWLSDNRGDG